MCVMSTAAATAGAITTVASAVIAYAQRVAVATVGVGDYIGGNGTLVAGSADDFSGRGIDCSADHGILVALAELVAQFSNTGILCGKLLLNHEIHEGAIVCILVFDDVAGLAGNGVAQIAEASRQVIADRVDISLCLAATAGDRALDAIEAGQQSGVHGVEAIAQTLLDATDAVFQTIQREAGLDTAAATEAAEATAKAAAKQRHQHDQAEPAVTTAKEAVTVLVRFLTHQVTQSHVVFTHKSFSFQVSGCCVFLQYPHGPRFP